VGGRVARFAGASVLVVGLLAALVLWLAASRRYDHAVNGLAPVPIGCTTTLEFERPGTYTFFVETRGSVGEIDGDCVTDGRTYDVDADEAPRVSLSLLDRRGAEVDLERADGPSYDRGGRRGSGIRTVEIDERGEYELTATASTDDAEVLVRVGQDPSSGVTALRASAAVTAFLALCLGLLLMLVLGRPRPAPPAVTTPGPRWPSGDEARIVPLAPPTDRVPSAPPYAPRPASHPPLPSPPAPGEWRPQERPPGGWPGAGRPLPPPDRPR
jgi:hypothetical protein